MITRKRANELEFDLKVAQKRLSDYLEQNIQKGEILQVKHEEGVQDVEFIGVARAHWAGYFRARSSSGEIQRFYFDEIVNMPAV